MNKIDSLKIVLEFYRELGFDRLPLNYSGQQSVVGNQGVKRSEPFERITTVGDSSRSRTSNSHKEALLKVLRDEIGDCQRCKLSKGRTHIVFGEGNANARIMFIGEGPGREEDLQARPFVGDAGQLLTRLIERMGFKREDVYIANIVKCRPPMNRDPQEDEISACFPFLDKQIDIISPMIIMALGKIASHTLMGLETPLAEFSISKARGHFFEYKGIPVMPTFHPAYLLRNTKDKWFTWEDAQAVLKKLSIGTVQPGS